MPLRKRTQKRTQKRAQKRSFKRSKVVKNRKSQIKRKTSKKNYRTIGPRVVKRLKGGEGYDELDDELDECENEVTDRERLECKIAKIAEIDNPNVKQTLQTQLQTQLEQLNQKEEKENVKNQLTKLFKNKNVSKQYQKLLYALCDGKPGLCGNVNDIYKKLVNIYIYCKDFPTECGNLTEDKEPDIKNVRIKFLQFHPEFIR